MLKTLLKQIKQYRKASVLAAVFTVLEVILELIIPMLMASVIDNGIESGNINNVYFYGLCMIIAAVLGLVCGVLAGRYAAIASAGVASNIRDEMYENIQTFAFSNIDKYSTAGLITRLTTDVTNLQNAYQMIIRMCVRAPISLISALIMALYISAKMGGIFCIAIVFLTAIIAFILWKTIPIFSRVFQKYDDLNILMPIIMQIGNVSYVICAVIGSILILNGYAGLSVGMLVSFLTLNKNFNQPFGQVSQQLNSIIMATAGINRIYALLDEESESDNGYISLVNVECDSTGNLTESTKRTGKWAWKHYHKADDTTTYQELNGEILFENVDFGYSDEKIVLHDINLFAKKGQKIAFVGSTGAGKTTITNLINRFYDIQDGKIRYDNINIRKIKKADLRKSLGVVLQDTHLFTGTIIDNIRYGRLDATDEECIQAAKLANADGFIRMLPDGYQTIISGDGGSLSQGQRQLLAIARAAVANPPVLVLDEATSSIDTHTEELVQNGMDKLMAGRTTFVIAHRLSTIRNADCIMVLENGKIIERGNHEQLIEEKGRYYQLYTGHSISE